MPTLFDLGPALRAILLADAGVSTLLDERVYRSVLPQNPSVPAVSFVEVSAQGDHHNAGPSGLASVRVQFNCWGATPDAAYQLGLKVKAALDGLKDDVAYGSNSPQDVLTVRGVFFQSSQDLYDDEAKLHYRAMDFIVWYAEF